VNIIVDKMQHLFEQWHSSTEINLIKCGRPISTNSTGIAVAL